jgi:hypothetical protein
MYCNYQEIIKFHFEIALPTYPKDETIDPVSAIRVRIRLGTLYADPDQKLWTRKCSI